MPPAFEAHHPRGRSLLQWIARHQELLTAITGIGTLLVWLVYLQVFISSYRRQIRATLLITRGAGDGLEARCFLSNMSSGPVYVQSVLMTVEQPDGVLVCPVTDMLDLEGELPAAPHLRTRQGSLGSGATRDIGSFHDLMQHALRAGAKENDAAVDPSSVRSILLEVVGIYGSEDLPIGARRMFVVSNANGRLIIQGQELGTSQVRSRRARKKLVADLERDR